MMVSVSAIIRGIVLLTGVLLVLSLLGILANEGVTTSRIVLFGSIVVATGVGSAGVAVDNSLLTGAGGIALIGLGFWQAVVGVMVVPVGLLFLFYALLTAEGESESLTYSLT